MFLWIKETVEISLHIELTPNQTATEQSLKLYGVQNESYPFLSTFPPWIKVKGV